MATEVLRDNTEPFIPGMVYVEPIKARYIMPDDIESKVRSIKYEFGYGGFSEAVFQRTYSRINDDGKKEKFPDTIVRVINGVLSIRKDWYIKHGIEWNENYWNQKALDMGTNMMQLKLLPPGRGLFIAGTEFAYNRGASAFNNCGFCSVSEGLTKAATWTMDSLLNGCGIGFDTETNGELDDVTLPGCQLCYYNKDSCCNCHKLIYVVHDSREGWVKSVYLLLESFFQRTNGRTVHFDYSDIRRLGAPIKGFGGISSGPDPLRILHERIRIFFKCFVEAKDDINTAYWNMINDHISLFPESDKINSSIRETLISSLSQFDEDRKLKHNKTYGNSRLITDIYNSIGICVVAGNVRRSSEIALARVGDAEFLELKNYSINPERMVIGWMSNNSVVMRESGDFRCIPSIARRIKNNGEPGFLNFINISRFGRVGKRNPIGREAEPDMATGINPCSEIPLESFEFCNLAEIFPSRCSTFDEVKKVAELATLYSSTVSLLPTHWSYSNHVIAKNRRIGISLSGIAEEYHRIGFAEMTSRFRELYRIIRITNKQLADEAGVKESLRVSTVKPSGTISQLVGVPSGIHFNTYQYCIRRMRIAVNSDIVPILKNAGYRYEPDVMSGAGTLVFEFPLYQGDSRTSEHVSVWEQAALQAALQREFSDNSVSCTLYFNPETEGDDLEHVLAQFAPLIKSTSALPNLPTGAYPQMPYEKITKEQYLEMSGNIRPINWDFFATKEEPVLVRGCDGETCDLAAYRAVKKMKIEK